MELLEKSPHLAELKLHYKTSKRLKQPEHRILSSHDAYHLIAKLFDPNTLELREEFMVVFLNTSKFCIGWCRFAIGNKTSVQIDIAHLVSMALLSNAHSVLLAHNHPSNSLIASSADKNLTKVVLNALHLHGIELLDHLIVTTNGFLALREEMNFSPVNIQTL